MEKTIKYKTIAPTEVEVKATEEYKNLMLKIKSMVKTVKV
jgi:hypothetical protein